MKKPLKTILCLTMALTMLLPPSGSGFAARPEQQNAQTVRIAVISDPHILPQSLINPNSQDFKNIAHLNTKMTGESEAIIKVALATIQARKAAGSFDADYLIIPGDLTYNGEKPGHIRMKEMLSAFEAATGVEVFVINGNHDINNPGAAHFLSPSGKRVTARQDPDL
ncbi:MAG TPA: metallophosphoesterase, partial [Clostridiales bacterium]|nr:metallophosphoesterase [Clostridiales bacterium]